MGREFVALEDKEEETFLINMLLASDKDGFVSQSCCFDGFLNGVPATFFLSNNSSHSFVRAQAMERAGLRFSSKARKSCQQLIGGHDLMTIGTVVSPFRIDGYATDAFEFQVLPSIPTFDVVLGGDWMHTFDRFCISWPCVSFPHNGKTVSLRFSAARRRITD